MVKSVLQDSQVLRLILHVPEHHLIESKVVLATCHSSGGRQLYNQEFDVVIIDEATQALEAVS